MPPSRYTNLAEARARFGDRVDRLAPYLDRTDTLADDAIAAIEALGPAHGWALISRILQRGIDDSPDAPPSIRALFAHVDDVPAWVDWEVLDAAGRLFVRSGIVGGLVLAAKSLVHGYASPGGNKPLVFSGRLTGAQTARRLNETSRFVQAVTQPSGMKRGSEGFAITVKVRLMHAQVRRMIERTGRWDYAAWGAPINQHDTGATTLLFSLSVLEGLRTLGLDVSRDEAESFIQLWRYVGHVLGGDPCVIPASEPEARRLAELISATQGPPDDDARALTRALMDSGMGVDDPKRFRLARRRGKVGRAICRALVGEAMADALGVRASPWDAIVPALRTSVRASEAVRLHVPGLTGVAIERGRRYWERVVEIGLAGATAEFGLPDRLADASAAE